MRSLLSDTVTSIAGIIFLFLGVYALVWLFGSDYTFAAAILPIVTILLLERWYKNRARD